MYKDKSIKIDPPLRTLVGGVQRVRKVSSRMRISWKSQLELQMY
jgi:hypothetical protein